MKNYLFLFLLIIALLGIFDAGFLTYEHYSDFVPPCSTNVLLADCGKVLNSQYSLVYGFPLAGIGVIHYLVLFGLLLSGTVWGFKKARFAALLQSVVGLVASLYFVYLQLFVIQAICLYCILSAILSSLIFIIIHVAFFRERKLLTIFFISLVYKHLLKPIFFNINPEIVHENMVRLGQRVGSWPVVKFATAYAVHTPRPQLEQKIEGISFPSPLGLSAGFDYEGRLTQTLEPWGFGFQTIGTITNMAYEGNPKPMLGRLPKSKSLMVNKGFKNLGAKKTIAGLSSLSFRIPVGVSIGRTNTRKLVTQKESIADIIQAFTQFEKSHIKHSYYELNISCPNLYGDISFYPPKNLEELLSQIDMLHVKRPIFVKMPIEKSDKEVSQMLDVISAHCPKGVIFGNLQKDRKNSAFVTSEIKKFPVGNFSGRPTFERSNELIKLAYKNYGKRLVIVGSGGIFSAHDAYTKITLGASLVQLITGMVFEGPQLVSQINFGLETLLKKDGFTHISQAVGSKIK